MRPPFFLENLIAVAAKSIRTEGKIYLPYGGGRHARVAGEDLARVAVGILTDSAAHRGKVMCPGLSGAVHVGSQIPCHIVTL
jgi:uncharacterized protein YbjT (DUF2867 family)